MWYKFIAESDMALSTTDKSIAMTRDDVVNAKKQLQKPVFINWWWISKILGRKFTMSEKQYYIKHYQKKLSALTFYDMWAKIFGFATISIPTIGLIAGSIEIASIGIITAILYVVFKCILAFEKIYFSRNYWRFYTENSKIIRIYENDSDSLLSSLKSVTVDKVRSIANDVITSIKKLFAAVFGSGGLIDEMSESKIMLFSCLVSTAAIIAYYFM